GLSPDGAGSCPGHSDRGPEPSPPGDPLMRRPIPILVLLATVVACSSSSGPNNGGGGGGGNSALTVSSATPSNGNGALTGVNITVDTNSAVMQGPAVLVVITGSVGSIQHSISLNILKSD